MIKHKLDDEAFKTKLRTLARKNADLTAPLEECAEILVSSIEQNFASEGRFSDADSWRGGPNKWPKSGAAKNRNGMTLSDSGQLRASVQANVSAYKTASGAKAEVGTNKEYAAVHNFGIDKDVKVGAHTRTNKKGTTFTVREHSRNMNFPARPFMVVQDEDTEAMIDVLDRHILQ